MTEKPEGSFQEQISFKPETVANRAKPGEVAKTRNLDEVKIAIEQLGWKVFQTEEGLLGATGEVDQEGQPTIKEYWDQQGRVCKTEFIGKRGAVGTDGMTNIYEYDKEGRLSNDYQLIHPKGEQPKMFRGLRFEYIAGRPDDQYTLHETKIDGQEETMTYEQRKEKPRGK